MRTVQLCTLVAALLLAFASMAPAQNNQKQGNSPQAAGSSKKSSVEETITMMERRAWEAVKARDANAFSALFAAEGSMADSTGFTTLPAFIKTLPDLIITDYTLSNIKVMMIDKDAALITYKADVKGSYKGQAFPPNATYVSSLWAKRGGKWIAVYHQETMAQ